MNQRLCLVLLLIILCLTIPSGAAAQYTITKISGDGQTGNPGQTLNPFVVEVRDSSDNPVVGLFVTFLHSKGSLTGVPVQTDGNGRAQSTLTLGRGAGVTTVTASVTGASVTFTATAVIPPTPEPPPISTPILTRLLIISGYDQTGIVGELLAKPFAVRVRDQYNSPLEGVPVTFAVTAGGGTLSNTNAVTDAKGRAESVLTLGSEPGTNTVEVRASGISDVRIFSAEATLPPPVPIDLSIVSGDNQTGEIDQPLATPFVVEVRDQYNDPMLGATVTFSVTGGGGTLSATTGLTDINGRAESVLTVGSEPGTNTVEVSVAGISQTEIFTAEATVPPPTPTTVSIVTDGDRDGLTVETTIAPFVVAVIDQNGDPMARVPVTFTIVGDDGSERTTTVTTDENGRAAFTLPPGTASGRHTVTAGVEGIAETVTFTVVVPYAFDLTLSAGFNLVHIPLKVRAVGGMPGRIDSVSDLYDALGGAETVDFLITHDPATQEWYAYFGEADRGSTADRTLTDQIGILADMHTPTSVRLDGDPLGLDGLDAISLAIGLNLVGLPLRDTRIGRVSDLFALEGIAGNFAAIVVTDGGAFSLVGRAGDPGDIAITGGQGFILIAQDAAMVPIIGGPWHNVP